MKILELIEKKKLGLELSELELNELINKFTNDNIPDYQMAALLMAIVLRGMTERETVCLTMAMARSGEMVDLQSIQGIKVDKHSTGGVADTTTLVVAPLVAATGIPVAKMSGRGLGFTGGTIDKLESIPGFQTTLSREKFIDQILRINLAIIGQSPDIAPADGKLYALRDVTGTVDSIPLIASSIMSKKIAAGADKILLDVKVGSGAFMKNLDDAIALAKVMVKIGQAVGKQTRAIISSMDEPLGQAIGNSLEVLEAIDVLKGNGTNNLRHVCLVLAANIMEMAGIVKSLADGYDKASQLLDNKTALHKFTELIEAQGGNKHIVENTSLLPQAQYMVEIKSPDAGFIVGMETARIGYSAMILGAGREQKGQKIDLGAGIWMHCSVGQYIEKNKTLAVLYTDHIEKVKQAEQIFLSAIKFDKAIKSPSNKLIMGIVDEFGFSTAQ